MRAATRGHLPITQLLVSEGADVNAIDDVRLLYGYMFLCTHTHTICVCVCVCVCVYAERERERDVCMFVAQILKGALYGFITQ